MGPFTANRKSKNGQEFPTFGPAPRHSSPYPFQWLGREDSNPYKQIQSLPSCHWTTPQNSMISASYETFHYTIKRQKRSIKRVRQPPSTLRGDAFERFRRAVLPHLLVKRPGASASSPPILRIEERLHFIHEFVDVLELAVDRGKPHVCHLVEVFQRRHDFFTYP
jgi:hypothetical protein